MNSVSYYIAAWTTEELKKGSFREEVKKHLLTVLKNDLFEGVGYDTASMNRRAFEQFRQKTTVEEWVKRTLEFGKEKNPDLDLKTSPQEAFRFFLEQIFNLRVDARIALGTLSRNSKGNYSSALIKFLRFLLKQLFWKELFPENPEFAKKRSPRPMGQGFGKTTPKKYTEPYALDWSDLPEKLQSQLEQVREFLQTGGEKDWVEICYDNLQTSEGRGRRPKVPVINDRTWSNYRCAVLELAGYSVKILGFSIEDLQIEHFTNPTLIERCAYWKIKNRNAATNAEMMCRAAIAIAKSLNFQRSKRRDWSDIDLIVDLRGLHSELVELYDFERRKYEADKWRNKKLSHPQLRECVQELRNDCAPFTLHKRGKVTKTVKRPLVIQLRNLQGYGVVNHLTYLPVRQQEPCQQRWGETFFVETDLSGKTSYRIAGIHHKNYWRTGRKREYKVPAILNSFYDEWLAKRAIVENALKSEENWLEFWGYDSGHLEKLKNQIEAAKQGRLHERVKNQQEYLLKKQEELDRLLGRINALPQARKNFYQHKSVFFDFGFRNPEQFGLPLKSLTHLVKNAMGRATSELYGVEIKLNPHAFRNIAAKWIRDNKGDTQKSALLQGHSEEEEKEYADKLTFEEEELEDFTDGWWEISINNAT